MNHRVSRPSQSVKVWWQGVQIAGLVAISILTFLASSTLLFGVLGLAPSSPNWKLAILLGGVLAMAGGAAGVQTLKLSQRLYQLAGLVSGGASGSVLGFYSMGKLSGQESMAVGGAVIGGIVCAALAGWSYSPRQCSGKRFVGVAISLVSTFCAYGVTFGLGAWMFAAISTGHWGLGILLLALTGLYLWLTRRSLLWVYQQWRQLA